MENAKQNQGSRITRIYNICFKIRSRYYAINNMQIHCIVFIKIQCQIGKNMEE